MDGTGERPSSSDVLAASLHVLTGCAGPEEVLRTLAALVVPALGTWCLADLLQPPDLVTRVAALGPDGPLELAPEMGRPFSRRSSAQAQGILTQLVESPQGVLHLSRATIDAMTEHSEPRMRVQASMAMQLGTDDLLVVALICRNRPLGVLTLGRAGAPFTQDEQDLLRDLALMAGFLLDNFRLASAQRNIAAALQTHLLPPLPAVPGLTLTARYVPANLALDVGGDWYDVFTPRPGVSALVVGDATGHDVDAATRMAEVRNLLRAIAVATSGSTAETLARLDAVALALGAESSATCVYAEVHHAPQPELRWSNAGHLPLVLVRREQALLLERPPELMLGVDASAQRTEHRLPLEPGDRLLLLTDGLVETRSTPLGERLETLRALMERLAGTPQSRWPRRW